MLRDRPGIEPATCKSQVQRPTAEPPRTICSFPFHELQHTKDKITALLLLHGVQSIINDKLEF